MAWFSDIGWWEQKTAYQLFEIYRVQQTEQNLNAAIEAALPIIRVVFSVQSWTLDSSCSADDLISAAAETICRAMPKMGKKSHEQIGSDKQYMRYLFTCVLNAFYREFNILQHKPNRVKHKLHLESSTKLAVPDEIRVLEAQIFVRTLPQQMLTTAVKLVRFPVEDKRRNICNYILKQLIEGREISNALLQTIQCTNREFFIDYCQMILTLAFVQLRREIRASEIIRDAVYA